MKRISVEARYWLAGGIFFLIVATMALVGSLAVEGTDLITLVMGILIAAVAVICFIAAAIRS